MKKILIIVIIIGTVVGSILWTKYKNLQKEYSLSVANNKAYAAEMIMKENNNKRVYQFTINQLSYFNDSIIDKLQKTQKELKIKNKRLQQMQYEASIVSRQDTLILRDIIFSNPEFKVDTIVGDRWFQSKLHLSYPNKIVISPSIELERFTYITGKRETIKPPKKFIVFRWFQKKHTVVEVVVKESNPYVKNKESKYIQIIK